MTDLAKRYGYIIASLGLTLTLVITGAKVVWLLSGISGKLDSAVQRLGGIESSLTRISEEVNHLKQRTAVLEDRSENQRKN